MQGGLEAAVVLGSLRQLATQVGRGARLCLCCCRSPCRLLLHSPSVLPAVWPLRVGSEAVSPIGAESRGASRSRWARDLTRQAMGTGWHLSCCSSEAEEEEDTAAASAPARASASASRCSIAASWRWWAAAWACSAATRLSASDARASAAAAASSAPALHRIHPPQF